MKKYIITSALAMSFMAVLWPTCTSAQLTPVRQIQPVNQYLRYWNSAILKLKKYTSQSSTTLTASNSARETITVTSTPLYTTSNTPDPKKTFTNTQINPNCNALPVNYKLSQENISIIFPPTNYVAKIYPGAIYRFTDIKNMSFAPYTDHTDRNPMDMTTTIFTASPVPVSEPISVFDFASVNGKWVSLLRNNISGSTPGNILSELILTESNSQMKADLKTMSQVDVGVKLNIPIPDVPVTVSAGENVSVTNTSAISSSSENQKNTVVLKFNQVFYSSIVTPQAANLNMFKNIANNSLPNDLLYVSSVDYGQVYYIAFTSSYSKETLMKAISQKVSTRTDLGVSVEGIPVSGEVSVGTSSLTESQVNSILSASSTSVKVMQFGGQAVQVNMGTSVEQVLNSMNLIKTQFSSTNLGAPISYTLNFCRDHALAYINYNLNYATSNCGYTFKGKYDVQLELDHFKVSNCRDMDGSEDLYGNVKFTWLKAGNKEVGEDKIYWSKSENNANSNSFRNGTYPMDVKNVLITGLTLNELKNLVLYIGGELHDDESILASRDFRCQNCQEFSGHFGKRKVYFADMSATQASINELVPNGTWQSLTFGADKLLTLDFYESGIINDGYVQVNWKVNVKPN